MSGADVRVLRPEGEIDLDAVKQLHAEWYAVAAEKPRCIIVDLSAVTFLDCTGIGLLVALLNCQRAHGGGLVLHNARPTVRRALAVTGLTDVFPLTTPHPTLVPPPTGHAKFPR